MWSSRFDEVQATCIRAEALGIDGFYYGESPNGLNLDCWTTLAALSTKTETIRLGPVISNILPTYRSLVLLARQAATVAAIAPGRVDLRTGVGAAAPFARPWWGPFGAEYPAYDRRLADLTEALETLPDLWPAIGFEMTAPPITVAARSRRAMHLAAAHADVWETSFCTPDEFRAQRAVLDALVDNRAIESSLEIDGFVATTAEGVNRLLDRVHCERGRVENLEPILERALAGTPEIVAEQLDALVSAGVDQLVVALHDPHDPDALEALVEAAHLRRDRGPG